MTREDIIRMAREAGFSERDAIGRSAFLGNSYDLERFAKLVAAHERESCAKVCDQYAKNSSNPMNFAENYANAIRARRE